MKEPELRRARTTRVELMVDAAYLLLDDPQMSRVDSPPLAQEVAHGRGTAVVDDRLWLVDQPVAELRDDRLDRDLVDRRVGRNARNHVPERDDLTELRRFARDSVMEAPLQVPRAPGTSSRD